MKKRNYTKLGAIAVIALLVGQVQAAVFEGTVSTDFVFSNNWNTLAFPATGDQAYIDTTADMTNAAPNNIQAIRVGTSGGTTGVLNLYSNAYINATTHTSWDSHVGSSGNGTLNMLGGEAHINFLEVGRNAGSTGTVNVADGYLRITRGSRRSGAGFSVHMGSNDGNTGGLPPAGGDGTIEVSGGTFLTRFGIELGNPIEPGAGTFSVQGSGATEITIGDTNDGRWQQYSNSIFRVGIDAGGITPITVKDHAGDFNGAGNVRFEAGSLLDISFIGGHSETGTWTVMTWEGDFINLGLELTAASVSAGWDAGVSNNTLVVSYGEDAPELPTLETPLSPNNMKAHPTAPYQATLTWNAALGADTYIVRRSETSGGSYTEVTNGITDVTYVDTTPSTDQTYYYIVLGENTLGEGLLSDEDSAVVIPYTIITYGDPYNEDYTVYNAFDNDTGTHYDGETDDAWIGLDFGAGNAQQVLGVSFVLRGYNSAVQYATNAQFQGANLADFSDAVTLHTVAEPLQGNPAWNGYDVTDPTPYRYVRLMTAPQLRSKSFAEVKFLTAADFTSNGTPKIWLDANDLVTGDDYEAADAADIDTDTHAAWKEYVAGTDPNDENSLLQVNSFTTANGVVISWQSVEGKTYSVMTNLSLTAGTPGVEATVTGLDGETSYTGTVSGADAVFYEIGVE